MRRALLCLTVIMISSAFLEKQCFAGDEFIAINFQGLDYIMDGGEHFPGDVPQEPVLLAERNSQCFIARLITQRDAFLHRVDSTVKADAVMPPLIIKKSRDIQSFVLVPFNLRI